GGARRLVLPGRLGPVRAGGLGLVRAGGLRPVRAGRVRVVSAGGLRVCGRRRGAHGAERNRALPHGAAALPFGRRARTAHRSPGRSSPVTSRRDRGLLLYVEPVETRTQQHTTGAA